MEKTFQFGRRSVLLELDLLKQLKKLTRYMKKLLRDAISSALARLSFPFLTPHPTKTGKEIGYFQKLISDSDLYLMYKRNQVAHNVILNVAYDVFSSGFECLTLEDEENREFDAKVQQIYESFIRHPLFKTYSRARLYGAAGMLIGYNDKAGFDRPAKIKDKISYIYPIPHDWVFQAVAEKDEMNNIVLPQKLAYYELKYLKTTSVKIHASRLAHVQPSSIEDDFEGESALFCIYDLLTVLKSMDWSIGQAVYRHGGGLTTIVSGEGSKDPQGQMDAIEEITRDLNTKTVLILPPKTNVHTQQAGALDPAGYYQAVMSQISAGCNIPVSILTGAQSGQGVSENDRRDYGEFIQTLQESDLTPILHEIIDKFQASGQLPQDEYKIKWKARTIFMIETSRARLYDRRAETEEEIRREVKAKTELYASRAKYWTELTVEKKAEFETKEEEEGFKSGERAEEIEKRGETAKEEE